MQTMICLDITYILKLMCIWEFKQDAKETGVAVVRTVEHLESAYLANLEVTDLYKCYFSCHSY